MIPKSLRCSGLSLVEVMAALCLSSLLVALVMGVVMRCSKASEVIRQQMPFRGWETALIQQLRSDYVGCRSFLASSNKLKMDGYGIDDQDPQTGNGPCTVEYFLVNQGDSSLLFRRYRNLLSTPPDDVKTELVCRGLAGFQIDGGLSTDIAPGVLNLNLLFVKEPVPHQIQRSIKTPFSDYRVVEVILARHGSSR